MFSLPNILPLPSAFYHSISLPFTSAAREGETGEMDVECLWVDKSM